MNASFAKSYITVIGVVLIVGGILGLTNNPLFGTDGLFATDALHNIVHVATGPVALAIGFGQRGDSLARGAIGFGWLYMVLFVLLLVFPTLFGSLSVEVNVADHFLHAGLGVVTLLVGLGARRAVGSPVVA
ncbi:MAG: DUF4383 domain-containing protein [Acidimicrobiia bacterium]